MARTIRRRAAPGDLVRVRFEGLGLGLGLGRVRVRLDEPNPNPSPSPSPNPNPNPSQAYEARCAEAGTPPEPPGAKPLAVSASFGKG